MSRRTRVMFIRRYLADRVHRLRDHDTTYCGLKANVTGERMAKSTLLGRCHQCEKIFSIAPGDNATGKP